MWKYQNRKLVRTGKIMTTEQTLEPIPDDLQQALIVMAQALGGYIPMAFAKDSFDKVYKAARQRLEMGEPINISEVLRSWALWGKDETTFADMLRDQGYIVLKRKMNDRA